MVYFPNEVIFLIFSFQQDWWVTKTRNRLINIQKLSQIPRPFLRYVRRTYEEIIDTRVFCVYLFISSYKYYRLEFLDDVAKRPILCFFLDLVEPLKPKTARFCSWTREKYEFMLNMGHAFPFGHAYT